MRLRKCAVCGFVEKPDEPGTTYRGKRVCWGCRYDLEAAEALRKERDR